MDILIIVGLIGLSAVISTAEIGFFAVMKPVSGPLPRTAIKRAAMALELRSDPQKLLSTILVGDRLVGTAIPMFATFITLNAYGGKTSFDEAIAVTVGVLTFVLLVSVDVIPKTLAAKFAVPVTLNMAYPVYGVQLMLKPLLFVMVGGRFRACAGYERPSGDYTGRYYLAQGGHSSGQSVYRGDQPLQSHL